MRTKNIKLRLLTLSLGLVFSLSFVVSANHDINQDEGAMIDGYDVVAYHTLGKAKKGSHQFSTEWLGGKWLFVNDEHRELFVADPASYIPQYGGYCAASYAEGKEHGWVNPKAWQVVEGKLYLFYGKRAANRWDFNRPHVQQANKKWEKAKDGLLQ